ncbi:MAG: hypothetical protein M0R77_14815, partial [Gammaproteobacteria bacterium]|nr:hypothetical protein [Gammaproteobacteria bacterium]
MSQQLHDFRFDLHSHLISENVRLYIYLGRFTSHDQEKYALVCKFRQEMESIGKTALRLLKKYETLNINRKRSINRTLPTRQRIPKTVAFTIVRHSHAKEHDQGAANERCR